MQKDSSENILVIVDREQVYGDFWRVCLTAAAQERESAALLGELGTLYACLSGGGSVADAGLPSLGVSYVDYAAWQRTAA